MARSLSPASGQSPWVREYEQIALSAYSFNELKDLSVQYISRQRDELCTQVERCRAENDQIQAHAERGNMEGDRLRDVLKRLQTDLEARPSRITRTDAEDLRSIVTRGLHPAMGAQEFKSQLQAENDRLRGKLKELEAVTRKNETLFEVPSSSMEGASADGSSANVMKRLRARVERLERENKRLEKECEHLKLDLLVAQRQLKSAGVPSYSASSRQPRRSYGSAPRSPRPTSPHRALANNVSADASSVVISSGRVDAEARPRDERECRLTGEKDQLLSMVEHLEKEQAEQQQYADQVVNQLGQALRSLEADNALLQEARREHELKLSASLEARRKVERQLHQSKAENEALIQQVMSGRSEPTRPAEASRGAPRPSPPQSSRSPRPSQPSRAAQPSPTAVTTMSASVTSMSETARTLPAEALRAAKASKVSAPEPTVNGTMQAFLAADLTTEPGFARQGRGVAWQPLDGSFDGSPSPERAVAEVPSDLTPTFDGAAAASIPIFEQPPQTELSGGPPVATPAWALMAGSPADVPPRIHASRRVADVRPGSPGPGRTGPARFTPANETIVSGVPQSSGAAQSHVSF